MDHKVWIDVFVQTIEPDTWYHKRDRLMMDLKIGLQIDGTFFPEILKFIFCLFFGFDEIIF